MPPRRLRPIVLTVALAAALGCPGEPAPPIPAADFLVAAGDSTYWVRSEGGRVLVRGAPLQLARVEGRFVELYIVDDDRSYYDAILVGQRVYRRDLLTNDSVLVFRDTIVGAIAERYAELNPDEMPLGPDDEAAERPELVATVEIELLPAYGPQLSYEYHADVEARFTEELHETRRGVLDLRSGDASTLDELFGDSAATRLVAAGRRQFDVLLDSVLAARREGATRAARAIDDFSFDPTSFSLLDSARTPQVVFVVPGRGDAGGGLVLPVTPIDAPAVPWWSEIADRLPLPERTVAPSPAADSALGAGASGAEVIAWPREMYDVLARYDAADERDVLSLRDTLHREWKAARLPAPILQIFWLDRPAIDSATRRALESAFDEAALYSEEVRSVSRPRRRTPSPPPRVAALRTRTTS
jgi:hypothetical protein